MGNLRAVFGGLVGAVLGGALAAALGDPIGAMLGISTFEGGRGFFIAFGLIPAFALAGLVLGVKLTLRASGSLRRVLGLSVVTLGGVAVAAMTYAGFKLLSRDDLTHEGPPPYMQIEVRLPISEPPVVARRSVRVILYTEKGGTDAEFEADDWRRDDDGRTVLHGRIDLYHRVPWRLVEVQLPDRPTRVFQLALPPRPPHMADYGPWQRVGRVIPPGASESQPAPADDVTELRVQVRWPDRD